MDNNDSTPAENNKSANPPEWGAPEWDEMSEKDFADNLIAKVEGEEAILTPDEMDIIEKFWEQGRRTRRCTLIALTKPYSWLREHVEKDTEFAQSMVELNEFLDVSKYEHIASLLLDAQRRLICAISCREDMQELMNKVKAEQEITE